MTRRRRDQQPKEPEEPSLTDLPRRPITLRLPAIVPEKADQQHIPDLARITLRLPALTPEDLDQQATPLARITLRLPALRPEDLDQQEALEPARSASDSQQRSESLQPVPLPRKQQREPFPIRLVSCLVALTVLLVLLASMTPQLAHLCESQGVAWCIGKLSCSTSVGSTTVVPPPDCPVMRSDPTFGVSLIDSKTGQPICERNADGIAQPASTTKVMTALLTEEYLQKHHLRLDRTG